MSLERALLRIVHARQHLHAETCVGGDRFPCVGCPNPMTIAMVIDWLDEHPRDARGARRIFHDAACVSGCLPGDDDHANRTQAPKAAALRRFRAGELTA